MGDQLWLDSVRQRLTKHDLPSSYVQRFTEELGDHLEDLKEESMETDAISRLGEPEEVAEAAVTAYRRRSFLGRHPVAAFLVFAVSPVIPQYVLGAVPLLVLSVVTGNFQYQEYDLAISLTIIVCSTFVGILYGELAMRLGIGKRWMLTSFAVLGVMAVFWEFGLNHANGLLAVRIPVQFAVPLAVGWWFAKRTRNHGYPVTTFFIFAISPVVSVLILWIILALAMIMIVRPLVGPDTFAAMPSAVLLALAYANALLLYLLPTAVASLLYCKLTKGSGSGRKWMVVSCSVLATFTAMLSLGITTDVAGSGAGLPIGLAMFIILAQFLIPLATCWWFLRRTPDQSRLKFAS